MREFNSLNTGRPLPRNPEEMLAYFCDEKCRERVPGRTQDELDAVCEHCAVEQLMMEADARELRARTDALDELDRLVKKIAGAGTPADEARVTAHGARQYLKALKTAGFLNENEIQSFVSLIGLAESMQETRAAKCSVERKAELSGDDPYKPWDKTEERRRYQEMKRAAKCGTHDYAESESIEGCTVQVLKCRKCGYESFGWRHGDSLTQKEIAALRKLGKLIEDLEGFTKEKGL